MRTSRANTGYVGYSMSVNAESARGDGRYPKGDFMKEYHITAASLELLVTAGVIDNTEWHHTSKYFNRTTFYRWIDDDKDVKAVYSANKKAIDAIASEYGKLTEPDAKMMLGGYTNDMHVNVREHMMSQADKKRMDAVYSEWSSLNAMEYDMTAGEFQARRTEIQSRLNAIYGTYENTDEYRRILETVEAYEKALRETAERRESLKKEAAAFFE